MVLFIYVFLSLSEIICFLVSLPYQKVCHGAEAFDDFVYLSTLHKVGAW